MGVAEGVDVEDVDVSWGEEEVLDELVVPSDIERWQTRGYGSWVTRLGRSEVWDLRR